MTMTRNYPFILSTLLTALLWNGAQAATTVNVTSNSTWSAKIGSSSWYGNYIINVSPGVTFTINVGTTCNTCTFNGGNIDIASTFTCQGCTFNNDTLTDNNKLFSNQSPGTTFTNAVVTLTGTASLDATGPLTLTNTTFNLSGTSFLNNNGGAFNATSSHINLKGNSYFKATSGPINLKTNTQIVAGDGTSLSSAYIFFNMGNSLNIYDNSIIKIAGTNNHYENNATYTYHGASSNTTFTTTGNSIHCGAPAQPHPSCNTNYVYGCATINSGGALGCTTLATTDIALSGAVTDHHSVILSWSAGQEINAGQFEVERSANGGDWEKIGTLSAKGYTTLTNDYHFTDASPLGGRNDYRVHILDKDGRGTYSLILPLTVTNTLKEFGIYPNPVIGSSFQVKAPSASPIVIHVFTLGGQSLYMSSLQGQTQYRVNLPSTIPHNSYIVIQVIGTEKTQAFTVLNQ